MIRRFLLALVVALLATPVPVAWSASPTHTMFGTVSRLMGDDLQFVHMIDKGLRLETGTTSLKLKGVSGKLVGRNVRIEGSMSGDTLTAETVTPLPTPKLVASGSTGTTVAVILLNFADNRAQPWTVADVRARAFTQPYSVDGEYAFSSDQTYHVTGDVFGWYPITQTQSPCNFSGWASEARTLAINAGVNLAAYEHVQYAWPFTSSCGFSGLAQMPGSTSWINGSYNPIPAIPVHEFGHNLGLQHAASWACGAVPLSDSCTHGEYGDTFAMMGTGDLLSNWSRAVLGWITPTVLNATGAYLLAPSTTPNVTNRLLSIPRTNGTFLHLEFRQIAQPFSNQGPTDPIVNGVTVRVAGNPANGAGQYSHLLDMTPSTQTFWDAPLPVGQSFTDNVASGASGVKITTVSVGPSGSQVRVEFPGITPPPTSTTVTPPPTTTTITPPPTTTTTTLPPPPGTISLVQTIGKITRSMSGNATTVVPVASPVAVGHRVIITANVGTFSGLVTCTDSRGNVYAVDGRSANNALVVCSAPVGVALGPGDTITVKYPAFSGASVVIANEFAGVTGVDGKTTGSSTSTRTVSVPALTTSGKALLVGAVGGIGFVPASGWAAAGTLGSTFTEWRAVGSSATISTLGTVSSGAWRAVLVAYRG